MADERAKRPRGRPPLQDGQKSINFQLRVTEGDYDKASALAQKHRTSISNIFRAAFRVASRQKDPLEP